MSAKAIFTDFRIVTDLKVSQEGRRIDFAIADAYDENDQIKHKIWVCAFDEAAAKITRFKAKKGSIVDITADLVPFFKKGNKEETDIGYRILDLSYSKSYQFFNKNSEKEKDKEKTSETEGQKPMSENDKKIASIKKAAEVLATNPFF